MRINGRPKPDFKMFLNNNCFGVPDIFPFNSEHCDYFYSARYALSAAIELLQLPLQKSVLLPSYNCGVEVEPFIHCGLQIRWYRVNSDMTIDVDDILNQIGPDISAVLITHYLGFPQPLDVICAVCRENGIAIIEDCAHALLSNCNAGPLGSLGDVAIFSFRKTLPVPEGGALLVNNVNLLSNKRLACNPNYFSTYYVISEMIREGITSNSQNISFLEKTICNLNYNIACFVRFIIRSFNKIFNKQLYSLVYPHNDYFNKQLTCLGISHLAEKIINCNDYVFIKKQRRENFIYLLENIDVEQKYTVIFNSLPEGVCPLFFPVLVDNRDIIFQRLKNEGVDVYKWWGNLTPSVPWDKYPNIVSMKKNILGLPVHQDLSVEHMKMMLDKFKKCINN